jgi:hypothetical protein
MPCRRLIEVGGTPQLSGNSHAIPPISQRQHTPSDIAKPVRPKEFTAWMAIPFLSLFIGLAITLAIIFAKARLQGMLSAILLGNARLHLLT